MSYLWLTLGWIFAILFAALTTSMLLLHNWLPAAILIILIFLVLPPASALLYRGLGLTIHPVIRGVLMAALLLAFGRLLVGAPRTSIYNTPEVRARFEELYDAKMQEWPVPYDDLFVDTRFGTVHVIACGSETSPPLLLLHASGVAGWSWKFNAGELSKHFRIYAIDTIGDAGRSEYADLTNVMKSRRDQAELYAGIADSLGVRRSFVVGASEGGFIGTNYATAFPERVEKLALLGPMGYTGATGSVVRITLAQFFPLPVVHGATFRWAFGEHPRIKDEFGEWFSLFMKGTYPAKVPPMPIPSEVRRSLSVPTMFVFGARDHLVGDPSVARELVGDIPGVRVEVVEAGHLMGAEVPQRINALLLDFFGFSATAGS